MKKILSIISLAFALSFTANAQFLNTTEIVNSDCRIQFLNSNGIKIYELIGENLTWWKQSSGAIIIRDKVTQVTISATYSGTPSLSALDDSLDAWILACKDCCSGGGGGGSSVGLNSFQFSNGSGGFKEINETIIDEIDTFVYFMGLGEGDFSFKFGGNNTSNGLMSATFGGNNTSNGNLSATFGFSNTSNGDVSSTFGESNTSNGNLSATFGFSNTSNGDVSATFGVSNTSNGFLSATFGGNNTSNGIGSATFGAGNLNNVFGGLHIGKFGVADSTTTEAPSPQDNVFQIGAGIDENTRANAMSVKYNGSLTHNGAYSNTAYEINTTNGGFTISDNIRYAVYNPGSLQATATITMPANPYDGQYLTIAFGGTITTGTVVTALTIAANVGDTILLDTAGNAGTVINPLTFIYLGTLNQWRLVSN